MNSCIDDDDDDGDSNLVLYVLRKTDCWRKNNTVFFFSLSLSYQIYIHYTSVYNSSNHSITSL